MQFTFPPTDHQVRKPSCTPQSDAQYDSFLKLVARPGELSGIDGYFINKNMDMWRAIIDKNNLTPADFKTNL